MKIHGKISELKTTVKEIKKILEKSANNNVFEKKNHELSKEIERLKKGISESIDELEEIIEEENAKS